MTIAAGSAALASDELNVHNADGTIKNSIVTEATLSLSDVTTANVSTAAHGFAPKAPNDTTKFLRGDATWAVSAVAASQAEQESASSTTVYTSPGTQKYHPSAAKAWCKAGVTANILASYNVTSVTDVGTGQITFTWDVDFSSADYVAVPSFEATGFNGGNRISSQAAGTLGLAIADNVGTLTDPISYQIAAFGDQ